MPQKKFKTFLPNIGRFSEILILSDGFELGWERRNLSWGNGALVLVLGLPQTFCVTFVNSLVSLEMKFFICKVEMNDQQDCYQENATEGMFEKHKALCNYKLIL